MTIKDIVLKTWHFFFLSQWPLGLNEVTMPGYKTYQISVFPGKGIKFFTDLNLELAILWLQNGSTQEKVCGIPSMTEQNALFYPSTKQLQNFNF